MICTPLSFAHTAVAPAKVIGFSIDLDSEFCTPLSSEFCTPKFAQVIQTRRLSFAHFVKCIGNRAVAGLSEMGAMRGNRKFLKES